MNTTRNQNECQKAYRKALKDAQELMHKIERAMLEMPAAANGDWSQVGTAEYIKEQLQEISDQLNHEGEYANTARVSGARK